MSFQIPFKPEFFPGLPGESSVTSLLHISSLAYDLTHRSRGRIHIHELNSKLERAYLLIFAGNIEGNISHQKLRNCWVTKRSTSHTLFLKFRVFKRKLFRNDSVFRAQISKDN